MRDIIFFASYLFRAVAFFHRAGLPLINTNNPSPGSNSIQPPQRPLNRKEVSPSSQKMATTSMDYEPATGDRYDGQFPTASRSGCTTRPFPLLVIVQRKTARLTHSRRGPSL